VKVRYFAWVRERIGRAEEEIQPPTNVATIGELMAWLASRSDEYASAFADRRVVRAAIDHVHVQPDTKIANAGEIAFFPPMTGG